MPAVRRNWLTKLGWKFHTWIYRVSGGRLVPVFVLERVG